MVHNYRSLFGSCGYGSASSRSSRISRASIFSGPSVPSVPSVTSGTSVLSGHSGPYSSSKMRAFSIFRAPANLAGLWEEEEVQRTKQAERVSFR